MSKNLNMALLLDFYGEMLTEKQRELLSFYYDEDLSLSEISELVGTSRQGVMDIIHRGEAQLNDMESKLGFLKIINKNKELTENISKLADRYGGEFRREIYSLLEK